MAYQFIFGPVPSRRLGLSLGVDLMPQKTCSLDCVYCECGKTSHLTLEPREYIPLTPIIEELSDFLSTRPALDHITFSGYGEPTLHSGIGEIVQFVKGNFPQYKLALLTNGTLLVRKEVRRAIRAVDVVIVSLDAGTEATLKKINRPHPRLTLKDLMAGILSFKREFENQLWLEVFLVAGLNDDDEQLALIRDQIRRVKPDKIQLNTLDRPGTESWVQPIDASGLKHAAQILEQTELIDAPSDNDAHPVDLKELPERIVATIRRRPCTVQDIARMLGVSREAVLQQLYPMEKAMNIQAIQMPRGVFYSISDTVGGD
ncbi:MAG: radical SAM protein [Deltaproteobacteria bacterium]|nr:radical SAM protein [Deltaproteobacteria bacterium]